MYKCLARKSPHTGAKGGSESGCNRVQSVTTISRRVVYRGLATSERDFAQMCAGNLLDFRPDIKTEPDWERRPDAVVGNPSNREIIAVQMPMRRLLLAMAGAEIYS